MATGDGQLLVLLLPFVQPATLWLQHWQQVDKQLFVVVAHLRPFLLIFILFFCSPFSFVLKSRIFAAALHLHFLFATTTKRQTTGFLHIAGVCECACARECMLAHACALQLLRKIMYISCVLAIHVISNRAFGGR